MRYLFLITSIKKAQLQETVVTAFNRSERVRPSEVKLKDYTFKNPSWTAEFDKAAGDANNQRSGYEHYDYPGVVLKTKNQGKAFYPISFGKFKNRCTPRLGNE